MGCHGWLFEAKLVTRSRAAFLEEGGTSVAEVKSAGILRLVLLGTGNRRPLRVESESTMYVADQSTTDRRQIIRLIETEIRKEHLMPQQRRLDPLARSRTHPPFVRALSALFGLMLLVSFAACGSDTATSPTPTARQTATSTPTTTAATSTTAPATSQPATAAPTPSSQTGSTPMASPSADTLTLNVYFMREDKLGVAHRTVPKTQQVGAAAMQELLKGPTAEEKSAGLTTSIPDGTRYLGLTIANRIGTVNLSNEYESGGGSLSMAARLAQVVFTLTQFPTIDQVAFQLDGKDVTVFGGEGLVMDHPVARSNYEQLTPAILVETPAVGDTISSPVRLTGSANTFEAAFTIEIVDANDNALQEQHAMATSGSGTRGTFDVSVPFKVDHEQMGKVVVFELSAKDGSRIHTVEIPVTLSP